MKQKYFFIHILFLSCLISFGQVIGDYRSKVSTGNWNATSSWEIYIGAGIWDPAPTFYPGQNNGSYTVTILNLHTITIPNNLSTTTMGTVDIKGTLNLNPSSNPNTITLSTPFLNINGGILNFNSNKIRLNLPSNAVITLENGGNFAGSCTNNDEIYIGTKRYAACVGGGSNVYTFGEVAASGGNVNADITTPSVDYVNVSGCSIINLTGGYTGTETNVSYKWNVRYPDETTATIAFGTLADNTVSTSTSFTPSAVGEYLVSLEVTTTASATNIETVTFNVTDTTNPNLTAGANQSANISSGCSASVAVADAVFNDNCSGATIAYTLTGATTKTITSGQVGTYTFNKGTTTINYTVTDAVGNTTTGSKDIVISDTILPTLTAGANQSANISSGCSIAVAVTDAVFNDNCSGATIAYTLTGATTAASTSGQVGTYTFNKGTTTINYTVTDASGNMTTGSKDIVISDTILPTLTAGANQSANISSGCSIAVAVTDAVFNDNCSGATIAYTLTGATTAASTSGQVGTYTFNKGTTTINYTVTDASGNMTTGSKDIVISDTILPTLTAGANQSANISLGCSASVAVTDAVFNDNCSGATIAYTLTGATTLGSTSGQVGTFTFNKGTTTINYTVTDATGNTTTGSKDIVINDTIVPTLTAGSNQSANISLGCSASVAVTDAVFNDNCSGATIAYTLTGATTAASTSGQVGTFTFNKGTTTINYTVTDAAGNTTTGSKDIVINDTIAPTLTAGANQSANISSGCSASVAVTDAVFNDNCSGATIAYTLTGATTLGSTSGQVGTFTFNKGTTTINYTVTDAAGNMTTGSKDIVISDTIAPTLTAGANQSANISSGCSIAVAVTDAVFNDNCSGATIAYTLTGATTKTITTGQVGTFTFNKGTTTINYTVTDAAGNTTTGSKDIVISDTIAPTLTAGANQSANISSGCSIAVAVTDAVFNDNCSGATIAYTLTGATTKTITNGQVGTYTFNKGTTTINYTVTDATGNTTTGSKDIVINDTIAPTLTAGANQSANISSGCSIAVAVTDAVFNDNCSVATIAYTLTGATTAASTSGQVGTFTFNKGTTTINYTVTDAAGNTTTGSKDIVISDTIAPTLTAGANQSANISSGCSIAVAVTDAVFNDNCSGATISYTLTGATTAASTSGQVGTFTFNKGTTTINYTVTDAVGNTTTGSRDIVINDTIAPTLTAGANQSANISSGCSIAVAVTDAVFNDNCSGASIAYTLTGATTKTITNGQVGTYTFNKGTTTINYTVTDASGNMTTGSKDIVISDTILPTLTAGANQSANISSGCSTSVTVTDAVFNDNCSGATIAYTLTGATTAASTSGQVGTFTFNKGTTTINYTVTDAAGNTTTGSKDIVISDTILPTLTAGANQSANIISGCSASVAVTDAVFNDNCSGATIAYTLTGATTLGSTSGQVGTFTFNKGTTTINYTVTDATGNTTTGSKDIVINDTIVPTLTAGSNQSANISLGCSASVAVTDAVFNDNCSGATIAYTLTGATTAASTSGQVGTFTFNKGTTTINYTVTDAAGNTTTGSKDIVINDTIAPTLTAGTNQSANISSGCSASVAVTDAVFNDNCSGATIAYTLTGATTLGSTSGQVGTFTFNKGTTTINYTVTDAAGNMTTGSKDIVISDTIAPTLTAGANQSANISSGCSASVAVTDAVFNDNCSGATIAYTLTGATTAASTSGQVGTFTFNKGTTTINYTVTDAVGNTTTGSKDIVISDTILPTLTAGANQSANISSGCSIAVAVTDAVFNDNCSGASIAYTLTGATTKTITNGQVGTYIFNKGTTTINYTVTDASGNMTTGSKDIVISDTILPTLTAGANQSANIISGCSASVAVTDAVFNDNCSGASIAYNLTGATTKTITNGQVGTFTFNKGTTTINYTVTDAAGNTTTGSKDIVISDTILPTLTAGANQSANISSGCSIAVAVTDAVFNDNCSGASIAYTLTGATTKTITNGQVGTFTFNKGTTTINYTVTDAVGNTTTGSKDIVISDTILPTLTAGANQSANISSGCSASVAVTDAVFNDNCSGASIAYTLTGATTKTITNGQVGTYTFNKGTTTINYTVTDASGNMTTGSKDIVISDTILPTLTAGANQSANISSGCSTSVTVTDAVFNDNCSGATIAYTLTGATTAASTSGQVGTFTFNKGTTTINYTVTDAVGNITSGSKDIVISDTIAPSLTAGANQSVNTDTGVCTASVVVTNAIFNDNCPGATMTYTLTGATTKSVTGGQVGTYTFNKGVTTINYTVTDAVGNITTGAKTITVIDNELPSITSLPALSGNCSVTISSAPTSPDNCGTVTAITNDISLPHTYSTPGFYVIDWNFTDSSGNRKNISQTVTVTDNNAPVPNVTNLPNLNFTGCELTSSQLTYPTAYDTCNGTITGVPNIQFPFGVVGTTTVTWTYTDATGNVSTQTQNITLTSETINGGTLKGYLTVEGAASAKTQVDITSCSSGGNEIKMNLTGQVGTIIRWEKYTVGNPIWVAISNTTNNYTTIFYPATTESTYFRAVVKVGTCIQYSSSFYVRALPTDKPPVLDQTVYNICLNQSITLVARRGYTIQEDAIAGKGGDFDQGQLNTQDPKGWLVDGNPGGFTAGGNNTKPRNWSATNDHQFGDITYDSQNFKFAITSGNHNISSGPNKYTGANPAILETPIFSLAKMSAASLDFDQAYYFATGDLAYIYISTDGGVTYNILKTMHAVGSPQLLWFTDPNVTAAQKVGATATQYNFKNDNTSIPLTAYLGQTNLRIKWAFRGTNDKSVWAMDNISIPTTPVLDQIEWTDGIGNPSTPPITNGQLETSFNLTPEAPGKHQYGATVLVEGCRSYDPSGTALADVNVSYSYAGSNIVLGPDVCGSNTVQLNAYDNFKTANQNAAKGSYTIPTGCKTCNDPGTQSVGTWSISGTSTCGTGTFSNINDPDATFTGEVGNYVLAWTVGPCTSTVNVTISNCSTIDFDGTNDYVDFKKQNYDLNNNFSIEVWIKTAASSNNIQTIFSKRNANINGSGYDLRVQNDFVTFIWNGSGSITSPFKITSNRWYHIAVTYTNSEYRLYIDGLLMNTKTGSSLPLVNNYRTLLGAMDQDSNNPVNYFRGAIDELRIWNVALNEEQIHQMMNQEIKEQTTGNNVVYGEIIPLPIYGLTWSNLKGYYRMDQFGCGYLKPNFGVGADGKLKNITTSEPQTAPLPYYSVRNGDWTNTSAATPWAYGNTVWDYPNSTGINGQPIDWNIVRSLHNINSTAKDITLLGLRSESGQLTIANPSQTLNENNNGQGLSITHYLKLDGFIDLVGKSQLVQKRYNTIQVSESVFDEASSGYIERDQQGQKNSFNYNYWSSPVTIRGAANNSPYTLNGVLRDGTDSSNPKLINFGSGAFFADGPVTSPIKLTTRWIWSYNSKTLATNSELQNYFLWNNIKNTGALNTAEGFTMKGTGGSAPITAKQNYVFTGKPNSGTISRGLPLEQTYLIGNPYPSALDADEFIKDNLKDCVGCRGTANVFNGALYYWDHLANSNNHNLAEYEGGYSTYTLMGGVVAVVNGDLNTQSGLSGTRAPGRYIPVGQAFFVDAATEASIVGTTSTVQGGTLIFKNSQRKFYREGDSNSLFMKPSTTGKTTTESDSDTRSKIRLGFNPPNGKHRQILLGADKNTTNSADIGYDAPMFDLNSSDIYWKINNNPYVIQGVPSFDEDQIIPVGITMEKLGEATINIDALENIPTNLNIYLHDNESNTYHDIKANSYKVSLPKGAINNRFSIQFASTAQLGIDDFQNTNRLITIKHIQQTSKLIIENEANEITINKVNLFDINGKLLSSWKIEDNTQSNIELAIKDVSTGVYIVLVNTSKGKLSQQIIIN
ncbi:LamG-like jellyroll fold domain-containing protein [Flavobacterium sp. NG2]|uniref:T9SS type A sorting domain-containing protein n=1 Tax=Flavobacterium sp. NG2 TaxID=3097547 RepID=UPI002A81B5F1|nr:T9SS type A sorting domain-containing protein [Flavobacterium sp. NG2]WPR71172.1 LamG-like jellyroll fold domain-containing protein [Flavobacterium sp. NG2]